MTFLRRGGGRVYLSQTVVAALTSYRQLGPDALEAGGVVFGRLILGSADIVIEEITAPTGQDRGGRYFFFRRRRPTQRRVNEAWRVSRGTMIYLGEWHTHPEDVPQPSSQDLRNWKRISRLSEYEQELLLFLIVGRIGLRVWELTKNGGPEELQRIDQSS